MLKFQTRQVRLAKDYGVEISSGRDRDICKRLNERSVDGRQPVCSEVIAAGLGTAYFDGLVC
ncbi:hypothetical protein PoMZ_06883 [Pyricularia oryzae]|uniref:Uncharacterized protein n=1 Tax=Pyricularia oryzae TaxID=318829 RepID=A0A4P7NRX3_PYROR|nr:hypothetical protein PoMZ_06883 [Pyricularia oryzae]